MNLNDRRKLLKDNLLSYGIDTQCPVDYEFIDEDDELFAVVLELDSSDPPLNFHYSLIAKKYLVTQNDFDGFDCTAELVSIEYLGGVLKWWD